MLGVFLDLETTGLDPSRHRVVEVGLRVLDLYSGENHGQFESVIRQSSEVWERRDPDSIAVNGFTWEGMLLGCTEMEVSKEIVSILSAADIQRGKAVFICQNPAFDRPFFGQLVPIYTQESLRWPYHWLDFASMYWALKIKTYTADNTPWPESISVSKDNIAAEYALAPENKPHRALNGVNHLIQCYSKVVGPFSFEAT